MPKKTQTRYRCEICGEEHSKKSINDNHVKSEKHLKNCEILKLNLQMKPINDILIDYPDYVKNAKQFENKTNLIDQIIKDRSSLRISIDKVETTNPVNTMECQKYKPSNKIVWEVSVNVDINENYKQIKSNLESLIKQCHNILYSSSIVGQKAQNDIMRLLCIKILQYQFNDETSELWDRCNQVKATRNISDNNFKKYKSFCTNLTELYKSNKGILTEWKGFVNKFLSGENGVFPSIYYEDDSKFNCIDESTLQKLIDKIESIKIDDEFVDSFSTTCGDIHESFRSYGGGKGAKELGQYFTPRQLIHLIFHGLNLNQYLDNIENPSIYDPCMGTGGFLTRLFNLGNINPENIYGCETELDTIKFGEMSLFLTTKGNKQNIVKCNSICENPFIINTKVDAIVTNPPFDTKFNYNECKKKYNDFVLNYEEKKDNFEDIYPIKTANGACLFIQHCVYMLKNGGFCCIVLPNGSIFDGHLPWVIKLRKWLMDNVDIKSILKCPAGTFKHASNCTTNIVVFVKGKKTKEIKYYEMSDKFCNNIKYLFTVNYNDIVNTKNLSIDVIDYVDNGKSKFKNNLVKLKDICELEKGEIPSMKRIPGEYKLVSQSNERTHNTYKYEGKNIFVSGVARVGEMYYYDGKCHATTLLWHLKIKENCIVDPEYLYLILKNNSITYMCESNSSKKSLVKHKFLDIEVSLPDLDTQQKIIKEIKSTILNKTEQIKKEIDKLNTQLENINSIDYKIDIINRLCD